MHPRISVLFQLIDETLEANDATMAALGGRGKGVSAHPGDGQRSRGAREHTVSAMTLAPRALCGDFASHAHDMYGRDGVGDCVYVG